MPIVAQANKTRPIHINELLTLIFSFLDDRSISRAARVCKRWSDVALDILWHVVQDIRNLLGLLAPLTSFDQRHFHRGTISYVKFRRSLRASDWVRFDRYAHRVRTLDVDDKRAITRSKQLDQSVYDEMLRTCPRRDFLPNLQSLMWHLVDPPRQRRSLTMMHGNITFLSIHLHRTTEPALAEYVNGVLERAPLVTTLEIRSESAMRLIENECITLIRGMRHLRHLLIPLYFPTSDVVTALAAVQTLQTVTFAQPVEQGTGDRADTAQFSPTLTEGAFVGLQKLSFSAHLQHAMQFVTRPFMPRNITCLHLNILAIDNPPVLHDFLTATARFRRLTDITLDFVLSPGAPVVSPPPPAVARPNLHTLRPLLACHALRKFELRWDYQLNLSENDLEEMATSWPALEHLHLNSEPIPEVTEPVLTVRALIPFARHCLQLRYLSLYLNGDRIPCRSSVSSPPTFRHLQTLALGSSPVTVVEPAVLFLSQMCPVNCEIISGVRWPDAYGLVLDQAGVTDDRRIRMQQWWIRWGNIAQMLPLAVKARQDEKAKVTALQHEMDVLNISRREERERLEQLEHEVVRLKGKEVGP